MRRSLNRVGERTIDNVAANDDGGRSPPFFAGCLPPVPVDLFRMAITSGQQHYSADHADYSIGLLFHFNHPQPAPSHHQWNSYHSAKSICNNHETKTGHL